MKNNLRLLTALAVMLTVMAAGACGQTIGKTLKTATTRPPSDFITFDDSELTGLEKDFFDDLGDGVMDRYDYYDAFLVASEVTEKKTFASYRAKLESVRQETLGALKDFTGGPRKVLAKQLLLQLHDTAFKTYREKATLATDLLDRGEFNCLSSAILYALIADELGIDVQGVAVQGHAFCQITASDSGRPENVDVETTVRYGFEPGQKELDEMRNVIVSVPKKAYGRRENVPIQLLIAM
ncbi:MAG: hypothetical protein E4H36_13955, partial [Spirochaetales bacterium]